MIFEVCFHLLQCALRAFVGFFDLLYIIEIMIFDSLIEFIDNTVTQFLDRVTTNLETTADAAFIPFPSVQKTCEALESKLVPPQGTRTVTETSHERNNQVATIPVVRSFFVKICQALDLPATFVPQESDTALSYLELEENFTITGLTRTIQLLPILMTSASESLFPEKYGRYSKPTEFCDYLAGRLAA
ncbi:hypothetical protein NPIL_220961 [Nephila pilipes]|uniref:Uncharacterized protein n=1 Tax=Nephila pilipes TaxID=299642 RepID=A0A8X6N8R4_NEPPI|nr:hypothetical protein NPIL_220961 [Nephila pilipes]